jgi:transcriptional regulator with XRE-family HTH domain
MTEKISDQVGERIRDVRKQLKWTMSDLAARCAELGHPEITRSVIENIEGGRRDDEGRRRRDITVDELMAIAGAFAVPASALMQPLSDSATVMYMRLGTEQMARQLELLQRPLRELQSKQREAMRRARGED